MKPKIAYFTNIAPHYREKLWLALVKEMDVEFHFYFGYEPSQSIKSIDFTTEQWSKFKDQTHLVQNYKINNILVYQSKVLREIMFKKWDVILLLGTARITSVWLAAIIARAKGIPVIFWGHGLYGNEKPLKKKILTTFLSLADVVLVYGEYAKKLILKENFKEQQIKVVYNSINYEKIKKIRHKIIETDFYKKYFKNNHKTLFFIGRLRASKKLDLLLQTMVELKASKHNFNLMVIGSGDQEKKLKELVIKYDLNVNFYGACYDEGKMGKFIANADLCVSPGSVGLTAIHTMSYGTPVCTHDDFNTQMPEFESIIPWKTGCFYDHKKNNLPQTIIKWFDDAKDRDVIRKNCYRVIDSKYNTPSQFEIFNDTIQEILKSNKR